MVIVGYYAHGNKQYVAFNENEERPDRFMITDGFHDRPEATRIKKASVYIRQTLWQRTRNLPRAKTPRAAVHIATSLHRHHSRGMMDLCLQETTASYRLYRRAKDETVHIEQKNIQGC